MKKLFLLAGIICFGLFANAQVSPLLEKGKSGLNIRCVADKYIEFYGFGGNIGGSYKGIFDIEVSYFKDYYDEKKIGLITDDATSSYFDGRIIWWPLRNQISPSVDVSFGIYAGYKYCSFDKYKYNGSGFGEIEEFKNFSRGLAGFESAISFHMTETWTLQPAVMYGYEIGTNKVTVGNNDNTTDQNAMVSRIGITLQKKFKTGSSLHFTTQQFFDTYGSSNSYNAAIGYVFAL